MPTVERAGAMVEYEARGERGPVVVCAHNMLAGRAIFARQLERLGERFRVIAVDLRGHGGSRGATRDFSTKDLAGDLVAVLDAIGEERATFVGVSIGATASMEAALAHPSRVERLVLLGATARAPRPADAAASRALGLAARAVGMRPAIVQKVVESLFGETFRREQPQRVAEWAARLASMNGRDVSRITRAWATRAKLLDRIGAIRAPTLVLAGDEDTSCPRPHADEIAERVRGARVEAIARCGHTLPLEQPDAVSERIEAFLR